MKFHSFNSIAEVLMYTIMLLLLALNIGGLLLAANSAQQVKTLAAENQKLARSSQEQIKCIAAFFLVPNRSTDTLAILAKQPDCAATIKSIE